MAVKGSRKHESPNNNIPVTIKLRTRTKTDPIVVRAGKWRNLKLAKRVDCGWPVDYVQKYKNPARRRRPASTSDKRGGEQSYAANKAKRDAPGIESSECSNKDSKGLNRVEEKSSKNIISVRFPLRAIEFL